MPGKQVGMSEACYPDSLIGTIPNLYYYAANNPSEATIAKRRSYANTISCELPQPHSRSVDNLVVSLLLLSKEETSADESRTLLCPSALQKARDLVHLRLPWSSAEALTACRPDAAGGERGLVQGPEGVEGADCLVPDPA